MQVRLQCIFKVKWLAQEIQSPVFATFLELKTK